MIELHPEAPSFSESRVRIYKYSDNKEAALHDYKQILKLNPTNPEALKYVEKNAN